MKENTKRSNKCGQRHFTTRKNKSFLFFLFFISLTIIMILRNNSFFAKEVNAKKKELHLIQSNSMTPQLNDGDRIKVEIGYFATNPIKRGDVALFQYPFDNNYQLVQRVIGLPGDFIEIKNGIIFINHRKVNSEPISEEECNKVISKRGMRPTRFDFKCLKETLFESTYIVIRNRELTKADEFPFTRIPEEKYFVLGDNRRDSSDSRTLGFMSKDRMLGKVVGLLPLN